MTSTASPQKSPDRSSAHGYGPAVGEPPIFVDPRRGGSLIGGAGGLWFSIGYSEALGQILAIVSTVAGVALAVAVLFAHYVRPVALGVAARPGIKALLIYGASVAAEFALFNVGLRALATLGRDDLGPALIATVVGLHFIPFAWAFGERMFYWLGGLVAALGTAGMLLGFAGVPLAAEVAAVVAGLSMLVIILLYARGRFAPHSPR